jgi:uncharacterized protein YggE
MNKKIIWIAFAALVFSALILPGCNGSTPVYQSPANQNTGIWVNGEGKVSAAPDTAILSLGIEAQEASVAQAQSEASSAMNAIINQLGSQGILSQDIQTQQFSISPVYQYREDQQTIIAYQVSNTVTVKIRDINNTGNIIDAAAEAGGDSTRVNNISFTIDDPTAYQDEARNLAIGNAQAKASQIAEVLDITLGMPIYVSESSSVPSPYIQYPSAIEAAPSPTPISPGETDITVSVQIAYEIK